MLDREWPRSRYWLIHFLQNRHERVRIAWPSDGELAAAVRQPVADWLAWMAQVNAASRQRLIEWARCRCASDPAYPQAIRLFVKEEQHHGDLVRRYLELRGLSAAPVGGLRAAARAVLRPLGLRFELSVLLLSEILCLAMNRAIIERVSDPTLKDLLTQIIHDHECHLTFHRERLTTEFADFNFVRRNLRRWRLRGMFAAAVHGAAAYHRGLLAALEIPRRSFIASCWADFRGELEKMVPYHRETLLAVLTNQRDQPYERVVQRLST